jgi:hypothetical protein
MELTINERKIKITGSISIEKELTLGQDVEVKIKGSVVAVQHNDNQDGSEDIVFKVKGVSAEL